MLEMYSIDWNGADTRTMKEEPTKQEESRPITTALPSGVDRSDRTANRVSAFLQRQVSLPATHHCLVITTSCLLINRKKPDRNMNWKLEHDYA